MRKLKELVKKYFSHFAFFYKYLRYRIIVSVFLTFIVGLLDGFGLAMFLPLLQLVSGEGQIEMAELGGLRFLVEGIEAIGLSLTLDSVLMIIVFFFVLKGIALFIRQYYTVIIRMYFIRKLRFKNIDGMSHFNFKKFVTSDAGKIQNTMSGEVGRVAQAFTSYFNTLQAWIMMVIYLGLAFTTNVEFALLVVIGGALSNLVYRQIYRRTKENSLKISVGGHEFQGLLIQMVAFFKYLKATAYINDYGKRLKSSVWFIERAQKKIGYYNAILSATREPLIIIVVAIVILIQVKFLSASMGGIILSLMFFYRSLNFVVNLQNAWNGFLNVSGSLQNLTEFMKELDEEKETYGNHQLEHFNKEIMLDQVTFNYGNTEVLKQASLSIRKNSTVAFVGESGSGKTTLVNLITGLMKVDGGAISVDGINYTDLDIRSLQKRIGYITQDPVVFSDSIYDNVTKWGERSEENISKFWDALNKAAIDDFVKDLPEMENTLMGNNGIQVSGGQKQRISIARELYKNAEILVMDEATSALDSETERAIQENIEALKGQYTLLIVAHRLSTVMSADEIILLSKGQIVDSGTYEELMARSELFKKMVKYQNLV